MRGLRWAVFAAPVLAALVPTGQYAAAYLRAPAVVARVHRTIPLPLDARNIPGHRLKWLLAVQDPNFFRHPGVDLFTPGAGPGTITDGLVQRFYFERFSPGLLGWQRVRADIIALAFNRRVPKIEQLNLFLNTVYFGSEGGREIRGFDAASRAYFGKAFRALTDEEYLRLVAMILMPGKYHVLRQSENNARRVRRIQHLLKGDCEPAGRGDVEYPDCEVARL